MIDIITLGFEFFAVFMMSCVALMGLLYMLSPSLREEIKRELMR